MHAVASSGFSRRTAVLSGALRVRQSCLAHPSPEHVEIAARGALRASEGYVPSLGDRSLGAGYAKAEDCVCCVKDTRFEVRPSHFQRARIQWFHNLMKLAGSAQLCEGLYRNL